MPRKLTTEEWIKKAITKHGESYDYSKVKYLKSSIKVTIICPTHGEFCQRPNDHLSGQGCPDCTTNRSFTRDNFVDIAMSVHGDTYDYTHTKFEHSSIEVKIGCKAHGEFSVLPRKHTKGVGCPHCSSYTHTKRSFIEKGTEVHHGFYSYDNLQYTKASDLLTITCPIHGDYQQYGSKHLSGQRCPKCTVESSRGDTESFITSAIAKHGNHYDYSKVEYIKSSTKVTIVCPYHRSFEQTPNAHLRGQGCHECANSRKLKPISTEEFIKKCVAIHGDKYDYSKVVHTGARNNITIICPEHGEFEQTASRHSNGRGCQLCNAAKNGIDKRGTTKGFIEKARLTHGETYDYSKVRYKSAKESVTIICPVHGEFQQMPFTHLVGSGCTECANIRTSELNTNTLEQFIKSARDTHGETYDYSKVKYKSAKELVTIICQTHGYFEQTPDSHAHGSGCQKCATRVSKGEQELIDLVNANYNGEVICSKSHQFMSGRLELDIYLPDLNLAFEYNGLRWHSEQFRDDKHYHANKTKLCAEAGIRLIHIWEDDWRDNNEIEKKFICNLLVEPDKVIYARKTKVAEIGNHEANKLLTEHHIQGSVNATRHIGLFSNDELVAVGSFTHRPTGVELVRYVSSIPVIGGLGKVCKYHGGDIYTFCDLARFTGQSYVTNGFVEKDRIGVDYKYVVSGKRVHKFNFRKKSILRKYPNVEPGTELEMTKSLSIHRIWDCGKVRYIYENK